MSWLKPVSELCDIHVHAETRRLVQSGIGEMLDTKAGVGMREWIHANPRGGYDLNRTPEVLHAERMVAEECCSHSGVEGASPFQPFSARTGTVVIIRPLSFAPVSSPALVISLVSRRHMLSPSGQDQGSDVVQVEVGFLLFPHEGSFFTDANARAELRRAMSPARLGVKIVV